MNKLKVVNCLTYIMAFLSFSLAIFGSMVEEGIVLYGILKPLPFISITSFYILLILELIFKKWEKIPYVRIIYLILVFFTLLLCIGEDIVFINAAIWVFSTMYLGILGISSLFNLIIKKVKKENDKVNIKKLPSMIFTRKDERNNLIIISSFVLLIATTIILKISNLIDTYVVIVSNITLLFIFLIVLSKVPTTFKQLIKLNNDGKFHDLMEIKNELDYEILHEESRSVLKIIEANILLNIDQEKAKEEFNKITIIPKNKGLKKFYDQVKASMYIIDEDYDSALAVLDKNDPACNIFLNKKIIFTTKDEIPNVLELYPTNTKFLTTNAGNIFALMNYYYLRNNKEKAKEYAEMLINLNTEFTLFINKANEILND